MNDKATNEEVAGKWAQLENYVKDTLMGEIYIEELKTALHTPKINDSEVKELFDIVKDWTYQDNSNTRYITKFSIEDRLKRKKALNQIKTKFQQMQQEIQDLKIDNYQQKNLINKYHNIDFPNLRKQIVNLEEDNQQYKPLLDDEVIKIGDIAFKSMTDKEKINALNEIRNVIGVNRYNKLKSIGGNNEKSINNKK